jgi:hypothetical protein
MKILQTSLLCAMASAAISSLCSLIVDFGDWNKLREFVIIGAAIGFFAAPEIEPKVFSYPVIWQSFWGGVSAFLITTALKASPQEAQIAALVGTILGMSSALWHKHIARHDKDKTGESGPRE